MPFTRERTRQAGRFWWDKAGPSGTDVRPLLAVVFGIDALADIECDGHRMAYNAAFAAHDLDITWSVEHYRRLLRIPDERRRLVADLRFRGCGASADSLAARVHRTKQERFEQGILDADVGPRPGLVDLVMSLFVAGVWVAVATPGRRAWVQPMVRQLIGDGLVETIVTSDDLDSDDASVHALALWELGIAPEAALCVEGSAAGMRAATAIGLPTVMVGVAEGAQRYRRAAAVRSGYDGPDPMLAAGCARLHARWWGVRRRLTA